jgi:TolB-like protein/DNA-binding winged helix-turn-helix (wHTH) protein/Tfp pilus assembly protein PilF
MQTPSVHSYEFGEFQLDTGKRLLRRVDGTQVPLTPRVFETLLYMVEHHDAVLDKERIMEAVWPDTIVEENNLAQAISKLRQVFGETPGSHSYIVTVPGRGYRFVAEVNKRNGDIVSIRPADSTTTPMSVQEPTEADSTADRHQLLPKARHGTSPSDWRISGAAIAAIVIVGLAALFFVRYRSLPASVQAPGSPAPADAVLSVPARIAEKSIAVLPFDNLSEEKQNAYFAVGVQDEIMSDLARIADLKVISRTSANLYMSGNRRNSREIGQQLGVAHLLEGNVQRIDNRLRVNAQLIDARTDTHLWAQTYDRDFADVFAIQSEIAQTIADQLQAKLSPKEKAAIAERPTKNLAAYDLYLQAKELIYEVNLYPSREKENALKAVQLLDQAVARDPTFLLAHCQLAYEHDLIYFINIDHTETRLTLAETSVKAAVRLQPDAGETHLARATHFYWGYHNYDRAREELAKAQRALPNNAEIFYFLGLVANRQGRWDEIIPNLEHAVDLDPRNASMLLELGEFYATLRKHREAIAMFDRAAAVEPRSAAMRIYAALVRVEAYAEMVSLRTVLNTIEAEGPVSAAEVAVISFELALRERDPAAAARAFANLYSENYIRQVDYRVPRAWHEGLLAKLRQDAPAAHTAFIAARVETEKLVRTQPQNVKPLSVLALIDAELGDKENAIREGRTACDMVPVSKDALDGARVITILASIYAMTGEKDLALEQLETVSKIPYGPSYGRLRLDPEWDLLRGDPRFEQIVASLAPKQSAPDRR